MISSPDSVIPVCVFVFEDDMLLPLWNFFFSASISDVIIFFDLASGPLDGEGQVSELHSTMSKPILCSLVLKWLSLD